MTASDWIAIAALIIAILSAAGTVWQAWTTHESLKQIAQRNMPRIDLEILHGHARHWAMRFKIENRSDHRIRIDAIKLKRPKIGFFGFSLDKVGTSTVRNPEGFAQAQMPPTIVEPQTTLEYSGWIDVPDNMALTNKLEAQMIAEVTLFGDGEKRAILQVSRKLPW